MKRKETVVNLLLLLLLFGGVGLLLYPTVSDLYTKWQLSGTLDEYNRVVEAEEEDYAQFWEAAEGYNQYLAEKESQFAMGEGEKERIRTLLNPLGNQMMGYIEIPEIDVRLPIYQGTEETELQSGAGWWVGTSLPTGGASTHCVITAHSGLVKSKMFTDLDQLELGDTFTITVLDRVMTYEVDQILVAEPDDFSAMTIVEGEDLVTLYTCTPYGINTQRLLVRGHRAEADETEMAEATGIWSWIPVATGLALLLAAILILFLLRRRRTGAKSWRFSGKRKNLRAKAYGKRETGKS
ncbi:MAG: class C sortase [Candidatus Onthomonas sp.]